MKGIPTAPTMPGAYYDCYLDSPNFPFYFTKKNGQWQPLTYGEGFDFIRRTLRGLQKLQFKRGDVAIILSENRYEWTLTDYAIQWYGGITSAIYTTSSSEQIQYILNESESVGIFCSNNELLTRVLKTKSIGNLKWIVSWDSISENDRPTRVQYLSREEFLAEAVSEDEAKSMLPLLNEKEMAILLYTSGTTRDPKGVMLTHLNVMSNIKAMLTAITIAREGKVALSFLPLSHVYERLVHSGFLFAGLQTYFAESIDKLIDNLAEVRPQLMSSVPRIFEKMYVRIQEKVKSASFLRKKIFYTAFWIGEKTSDSRMHHRPLHFPWNILYKLADILVFRKLRAITGGRAEMFISGGAPLSPEIAQFFFSAGFSIMEGYGMSETCIVSVNRPEKFRFGTVGILFDGVKVKFADDGEILVNGSTVMRGYFKKDEENSQIITADGWFHTGDIGEFDADGFLKITDRKKELIVLAAGKKVPPQPLENALKSDPLVESACLIGDQRNYIVALIVPNLEMCKSWGTKKGFKFQSLQECATHEALKKHFQRTIDNINAELPRYSTIKYFKLLDKAFTIETGELTPTLKLKRRVIQEKFKSEIDEMFINHEKHS